MGVGAWKTQNGHRKVNYATLQRAKIPWGQMREQEWAQDELNKKPISKLEEKRKSHLPMVRF